MSPAASALPILELSSLNPVATWFSAPIVVGWSASVPSAALPSPAGTPLLSIFPCDGSKKSIVRTEHCPPSHSVIGLGIFPSAQDLGPFVLRFLFLFDCSGRFLIRQHGSCELSDVDVEADSSLVLVELAGWTSWGNRTISFRDVSGMQLLTFLGVGGV